MSNGSIAVIQNCQVTESNNVRQVASDILRRGELIKMGGGNSDFEILNWAFQSVFRSWIASGGGELGGNLLPLFSYKKAKGGYSKGH